MGNLRSLKIICRSAIVCITILGCCIFLSCSKSEPEIPVYSVPGPVKGKTYSADEVTAFKQLTINPNSRIIVKLRNNVSIYLVDTAYSYMTAELDSIIREINQLLDTNLVISRTTDPSSATIKVYLTDRDTYISAEPYAASTLQNSNHSGYAYYYGSPISRASAFVDMKRTDKDTLLQRFIIYHEIMHTLGFIGHVGLHQFHSVMFKFILTPYLTYYTLFDKRMMMLLYNPTIKSGMNEAAFNEAVKNL